ncbi:hypothetical protein K458DRAFT_94982 [Lentithecium fluviatile CBS 122367]|uniref:Uncharacterized protein n=1 Tax=Lentithecium fluviatile CBS 122367 TaxID=1168545 RepID=A0A6G1IQ74_9PLEO|nr:hypothetical protein K458DRAFT_94982 [Lentithecium fluviatile CBS 122367]
MHAFSILPFILLVSASAPSLKHRTPSFQSQLPGEDGLYCPSKDYYCCPSLETWITHFPCENPKRVKSPQKCYKKQQWACCIPGDDKTAWCSTGSVEDYAYRAGKRESFFAIGRGAMTKKEEETLRPKGQRVTE